MIISIPRPVEVSETEMDLESEFRTVEQTEKVRTIPANALVSHVVVILLFEPRIPGDQLLLIKPVA